jgi:hypothetical protein
MERFGSLHNLDVLHLRGSQRQSAVEEKVDNASLLGMKRENVAVEQEKTGLLTKITNFYQRRSPGERAAMTIGYAVAGAIASGVVFGAIGGVAGGFIEATARGSVNYFWDGFKIGFEIIGGITAVLGFIGGAVEGSKK